MTGNGPKAVTRLASPVQSDTNRAFPLRSSDVVIGLFIASVAFLLRLKGIGSPSLWVDEAASLAFSKMSWFELFANLPFVETNPPLYFAILKGWSSLAGTSEVALRMPGAIAGAASVLLLFRIAFKAYGRTAAIVAAAFLALSAVQVAYAQDARVFPFITLLFIVGLGLVQELVLRLRERRSIWVVLLALSVVTAGLVHLHYSAVFVAFILFSYAVMRLCFQGYLRGVFVRLTIAAGFTLVLLLPPIFWIDSLMGNSDNPAGWLQPPSLADAKYVFHQALGYAYLPFGRPEWLPVSLPDTSVTRLLGTRRLAEFSLILICAVGVLISLRRRKWDIPALVITIGLVVVVFFGVSLSKPILIERTIIFAIPVLAMIVGYSVSVLRWPPLILLAGASVMAFQSMNLWAYYPRAEKEPWRELFARVEADYRDGNAVVFASGPYLPVTISTTVLAEYYWTSLPKHDVFTLKPEFATRLYQLGQSLTPWAKDLDLAATCLQMGHASGVLVIFRRIEETEGIARAFSLQGSQRLSRSEVGPLGFEVWSPLRCP